MVRSGVRPANRHPSGFTLIELMISIAIIAILIALLLPAVRGAVRRARVTGVRTEISQLEAAIAKFKTDHGIEPPSSITLYETSAGWLGDSYSTGLIRQMWPQFNFNLSRDLNGDGTAGGNYPLSGSECLVFFLGGMYTKSTVNGAVLFGTTGFSKDPTNPFTFGGSREAPLFEFNAGRLTDIDNDSIPEYKDSIPSQKNPYLYYSGYDGQGFNPAEFNTGSTYGLYFPYSQGTNATDPLWKANSCQIISPGYDGLPQLGAGYGYGGPYIPSAPDPLLITSTPAAFIGLRAQEADNITNFAQGELRP